MCVCKTKRLVRIHRCVTKQLRIKSFGGRGASTVYLGVIIAGISKFD